MTHMPTRRLSPNWRLGNAIFFLIWGGSHTPLQTNASCVIGNPYLALHSRPENRYYTLITIISLILNFNQFLNT